MHAAPVGFLLGILYKEFAAQRMVGKCGPLCYVLLVSPLNNPIIRCQQLGLCCNQILTVGLLGNSFKRVAKTWPVQHISPYTLLCFIRAIACAVEVNYALLDLK